MAEEPFDLKSLGITADSPATSGEPAAKSEVDDEDEESGMLQRSAEAKAVDEHIKASLRKNVENHELACFVTDLVSPGRALERLGGVGLEHLPPTQHMIVSCIAIAGTVFVTNPVLYRKLKKSLSKGADAKELPATAETIKTAPKPKAEPREPTPPPGLRDLTGNPL